MAFSSIRLQHGNIVMPRAVLGWRLLQTVFWLVGAFLLSCLLFFPQLGLLLFWNVLIPVAPALIVIAPGLWRNVCPLATTVLLPRHLNLSKQKKLNIRQSGWLNLAGVVLLYTIVPLRHALFNINGVATAFLIIGMVVTGWALGLVYEWKSAWCSGLCPVHPVEKLYGAAGIATMPNMHCTSCKNCTVPCPDSTPATHPMMVNKDAGHRLAGWLIAGGLPGFIWGWFHVPDNDPYYTAGLFTIYGLPLACMTVTIAVYYLLHRLSIVKKQVILTRVFAFAAVSCYYWYRVPSLLGGGRFAGDGVLFDLHDQLPLWVVPVLRLAITGFFFYWLLVRNAPKKSWTARPVFDL